MRIYFSDGCMRGTWQCEGQSLIETDVSQVALMLPKQFMGALRFGKLLEWGDVNLAAEH